MKPIPSTDYCICCLKDARCYIAYYGSLCNTCGEYLDIANLKYVIPRHIPPEQYFKYIKENEK